VTPAIWPSGLVTVKVVPSKVACQPGLGGVTFVYAPQANPWGYGAELRDPDGHAVRLWDERSMKRDANSSVAPDGSEPDAPDE
jgi:hypothetical protein